MTSKLDDSIDSKFLEKNTRIRQAFCREGINTYSDLFERANEKRYNLYYVTNLGIGSIKLINQHVIGKFKRSMPNYKKNIHY